MRVARRHATSGETLGTGGVTVSNGGTLAGEVTILGSLLNQGGTVAPGFGPGDFGTIAVLDSFAQFPAGTLALDIGNGGNDMLAVGDTSFLGGTLALRFESGFNTLGMVKLIDSDDFLGTFSSVTFSNVNPLFAASLVYGDDGIQLNVTAIPEPGTYAMLLAGLVAIGSIVRRRSVG